MVSSNNNPVDIGFPLETEEDSRARQYQDLDPFPDIPPALLSSAEIEDYARVTGMVAPFKRGGLKSASYAVAATGHQYIWHEDGRFEDFTLSEKSQCVFPAKSISFIELQHKFRLPNYIAARFNLTITHVHRGLLLGTGPLIDPGFEGRLLIPIHNLTDADYPILASEDLIWMEFTKTTFRGKSQPHARRGAFVPFPESKKNRTSETYFRRANGLNPIRSSIPQAILKAENEATNASGAAAAAERTVRKLSNLVTIGGGIGLFAALATFAAVGYQVNSIVQDAHSINQSAIGNLRDAAADAKLALSEAKSAGDRLQSLEQRPRELSALQFKELQEIYETLSRKISELEERVLDLQMKQTK